jgi:hypothetical protein
LAPEERDVNAQLLRGWGRLIFLSVVALALLVVIIVLVTGPDYWEPEGYAGQAVFTEFQVSQEAHDEIEECGQTDSEDQRAQLIEAASAGTGVVQSFEVSGGEVTPTGALEARQIEPGLYEVSCQP